MNDEFKGPPGGGTWIHDGRGGFTRPEGYTEGQGAPAPAEAPIAETPIAPSQADEPELGTAHD